MQIISSLKDLEAVLDLCRKKRVMSISIEGISVNLHPSSFIEPPDAKPPVKKPGPEKGKKGILETINGEEIDEDVLYHSSGGELADEES